MDNIKYDKLTEYAKLKIYFSVLSVLSKYPKIEIIGLFGSYRSGNYVDSFTDYETRLKLGKTKHSDLDLHAWPLEKVVRLENIDLVPFDRIKNSIWTKQDGFLI
jgi:hypothetical protein